MFNVFEYLYKLLWPVPASTHEQHSVFKNCTIPFTVHIDTNRPKPRLLTPDMLERGLGGVCSSRAY